VGTRIYVVEGRSRVIQTAGLYSKGYDNSGQNDEEVDDEEYSDDEKEAEAKKQRKQKKRGADGTGKGGGPSAMRDGGLAAAAAAAGMGAGMPHYGNGPSRFQPKVPPAVQMAHMGIGGTPGVAHHPYAQAPQGAPMMMQTPAGMVPMMPGSSGGWVRADASRAGADGADDDAAAGCAGAVVLSGAGADQPAAASAAVKVLNSELK
jgi:H/ACA ribonucleoprotein complex non-core subunit NAF1